MAVHERERDLEVLARRQHGAFTRAQAIAIGFTPHMVDHRRGCGAWIRLDHGVFALASSSPTWLRMAAAATLGHPVALVSGRSACALHDMDGFRRRLPRIEVTVPLGASHRSGLAKVRRSGLLTFANVRGIPVITATHAFMQIVPLVGGDRATEILEAAIRNGIFTADDLCGRYVEIARSRLPGAADIRCLVDAYGFGGTAIAPSELQRRLGEILDGPDMPDYEVEVAVPWWSPGAERTDAQLTCSKVIIEADSRKWHSRLTDFDNDRRRDNPAAQHGYLVLRFGWEDIVNHPQSVRRAVLLVAARATPASVPG